MNYPDNESSEGIKNAGHIIKRYSEYFYLINSDLRSVPLPTQVDGPFDLRNSNLKSVPLPITAARKEKK